MTFRNMKLGTKLISAFVLVCSIGAVVSGIGIRNMSQINDEGDKVYHLDLVGLSLTQRANIDLLEAGRSLSNAILASSAEQRAGFLDRSEKNLARARDALDKARPLYWSEKGKAVFAELDQSWRDYAQAFKDMGIKASTAPLQDRSELTENLFGNFRQKVNKVDELMNTLVSRKQEDAKEAAESNQNLYVESRNLMIALVIFSALTGIGIGAWLTRSLTRQLGTEPATAADLAKSVAAGDLSVKIDLRPGDTHSLMASLKNMRDSLLLVVSNVRENADGVATASAQIAQGNLDLSSRTEEQASALEETAASMEQLTATVKQNAENAKLANELSQSASTIAVKGGAVVDEVVETMTGINDSSKKIAEIIGVIDGIAFQTNILALNAAVEAARAGDQGRGFAVVAGEVRNLAQRSAAAAKEIKSLISTSVERVTQGTALVNQAGTTMAEIVGAIKCVTDIMGEISVASNEQSIGMGQVGEAVIQMDQVTQQNAALVEESAAAAESLKSQAQQLVQAVAVFKLSDGAASAISSLTAPARIAAKVFRGTNRAESLGAPAIQGQY
ncbi:methyl-accepting chemotaxis protein [Caballeronia sordidicola]|jgi:methyl-accepting chemotaxis protein|uniref:Methyl-accepting chemotaxis protein I (Serine chemoreceptor protein) n=1 Tax=Caballeronia sordidicola TaxID=196367 RepID=A0A226X5R2_CABSO|nr:methyl-accepting chemotaxis protein [Caballeronia sordidicola]OXC78317.1 Methyl-accepting chemotaxis protein I (serine chemoreceptor protein) [Caballeronia sordidicola]